MSVFFMRPGRGEGRPHFERADRKPAPAHGDVRRGDWLPQEDRDGGLAGCRPEGLDGSMLHSETVRHDSGHPSTGQRLASYLASRCAGHSVFLFCECCVLCAVFRILLLRG